ncbi:MAG: hypothetical protein MZU79_01765 [Anaerotruncus sp.]|nr:hypothetical protein [Anaerotruncus sp.]
MTCLEPLGDSVHVQVHRAFRRFVKSHADLEKGSGALCEAGKGVGSVTDPPPSSSSWTHPVSSLWSGNQRTSSSRVRRVDSRSPTGGLRVMLPSLRS